VYFEAPGDRTLTEFCDRSQDNAVSQTRRPQCTVLLFYFQLIVFNEATQSGVPRAQAT
jgi:hypothetical protein